MSLLSYNRLCDLVMNGVIENSDIENVNSASIDITLGDNILIESRSNLRLVKLDKKDTLSMVPWSLEEDGNLILQPSEFILAQSREVFNLPNNISAEYKLKSSMARIGLEHLTAGWCDAGWHGSVLTLELKNMTRNHMIELSRGNKIGQIIFYEHEPVPHDKSYSVRGHYNNDKIVTGVKVHGNLDR